jgi:hypothetical protein
MIDLTKVAPFADAAWANEPNAPCLWCAGTGHVNGDYVDGEICKCPDIYNNIDRPHHQDAMCECGGSECLGAADVVIPVVEALAASLPQLESPMLKLIKERNEARELVKRMLLATEGAPQAEYYETMLKAHRAIQLWKGGAK